jgi:hypothetical protein
VSLRRGITAFLRCGVRVRPPLPTPNLPLPRTNLQSKCATVQTRAPSPSPSAPSFSRIVCPPYVWGATWANAGGCAWVLRGAGGMEARGRGEALSQRAHRT